MVSFTEQEPVLWVWPNPPKFCPLTYACGVFKGRPHPKQQRQAPHHLLLSPDTASVLSPLLCTALIKATRCLQPRLLLETQLCRLLWLDSVEHFLQPLAVLWHNLLVCKLGATLVRPEHKPLRDSQLTLTWMLCRDHIRKKRVDIQQNVLKIYLILSTSHFLKLSKQLKPSTSLKGSFQMRWDKRIPGLY